MRAAQVHGKSYVVVQFSADGVLELVAAPQAPTDVREHFEYLSGQNEFIKACKETKANLERQAATLLSRATLIELLQPVLSARGVLSGERVCVPAFFYLLPSLPLPSSPPPSSLFQVTFLVAIRPAKRSPVIGPVTSFRTSWHRPSIG